MQTIHNVPNPRVEPGLCCRVETMRTTAPPWSLNTSSMSHWSERLKRWESPATWSDRSLIFSIKCKSWRGCKHLVDFWFNQLEDLIYNQSYLSFLNSFVENLKRLLYFNFWPQTLNPLTDSPWMYEEAFSHTYSLTVTYCLTLTLTHTLTHTHVLTHTHTLTHGTVVFFMF